MKKLLEKNPEKSQNKKTPSGKTDGTSSLPIWFNKALENTEATDQDVAEMDEILAGLV